MSRLKKVIYEPLCELGDKYWAIAYGDHGIPLQIIQVIVEQIEEAIAGLNKIILHGGK